MFDNIDYLKNGNPRQQKAYKLLAGNEVMLKLAEYDPILVGTVPLEIDIASSDLDIICYWKNQQQFIDDITSRFSNEKGFIIETSIVRKQETVIANFQTVDFEIEIFGQNIPVKQQFGYRHMVIEHRLLQEEGEAFRRQIIELKQQGIKTEPAFCHLLGFKNDPYTELLKLENR